MCFQLCYFSLIFKKNIVLFFILEGYFLFYSVSEIVKKQNKTVTDKTTIISLQGLKVISLLLSVKQLKYFFCQFYFIKTQPSTQTQVSPLHYYFS